MRKRACYTLLAAALSLFLAPGRSSSQLVDDGTVSVNVRVVSAAKTTTVPLTYRLYGHDDSFRLEFSLYNETEAPIIVDEGLLKRRLNVRLRAGDRVRTLGTEWNDGVFEPDTLKPIQLGTPLVLEPQRGVAWLVRCSRQGDDTFGDGRYQLEIEPVKLGEAILKADNTRWNGRAPLQIIRLSLLVSPPSNARERADSIVIEGDEAAARGEDERAVAAYRRAIANAPDDFVIQNKLAGALLQLRRYSDSIQIYEQVLPRLRPGSLTYLLVAKAYLGLGDEASAHRALRLGGLSEERITAHIREVRARDPTLPR